MSGLLRIGFLLVVCFGLGTCRIGRRSRRFSSRANLAAVGCGGDSFFETPDRSVNGSESVPVRDTVMVRQVD